MGTIETDDGRTLAYEEAGDPAGIPIFLLHGTPGCRLSGRHPNLERVREAGLHLITYDRPGYGRSTRHRGRRVVDCVADIAAIADALGIERFAVRGGSGGGPHALAVGARLADRVTRVGCHVSPAPFDAPGFDWLAGMDEVNVREVGWAMAGEETLVAELEREVRQALERVDSDPAAVLGDIDLPAADRAILADPEVRERLREATYEMFAHGPWGWVDDDFAILGPWGFDVAEVRVPVHIRYGAHDVLAPRSHGDWLAAHVPNATVTVDQQAGHLLTPDRHLELNRELALG
jgi:pimeloyl-ACP methyl ester carboxylesterase